MNHKNTERYLIARRYLGKWVSCNCPGHGLPDPYYHTCKGFLDSLISVSHQLAVTIEFRLGEICFCSYLRIKGQRIVCLFNDIWLKSISLLDEDEVALLVLALMGT